MIHCCKCAKVFTPTPARLKAKDRRCPWCRNKREHQLRVQRADEAAKMRVRKALRKAVQSGRVSRQPCEVCAAPQVEAHHDDYSKPLDVRWLCSEHHRALHTTSDRPSKYGWEEMNVGDSLFVEGATTSRLSTCATAYARRRNSGHQFTTRTESSGARIWRTA